MKTNYKFFKSEEQANEWINEYKCLFPNDPNTSLYKALDMYIASAYVPINTYYRYGRTDILDFDEIATINSITNELPNYHIPDKIIVYRYISSRFLQALTSKTSLKRGSIICDAGLMSTSLLRTAYNRKEDQKICLIISVPKGTKGTYVGHIGDALPEYEIVLAPNTKLRVDHIALFGKFYFCTVVG